MTSSVLPYWFSIDNYRTTINNHLFRKSKTEIQWFGKLTCQSRPKNISSTLFLGINILSQSRYLELGINFPFYYNTLFCWLLPVPPLYVINIFKIISLCSLCSLCSCTLNNQKVKWTYLIESIDQLNALLYKYWWQL